MLSVITEHAVSGHKPMPDQAGPSHTSDAGKRHAFKWQAERIPQRRPNEQRTHACGVRNESVTWLATDMVHSSIRYTGDHDTRNSQARKFSCGVEQMRLTPRAGPHRMPELSLAGARERAYTPKSESAHGLIDWRRSRKAVLGGRFRSFSAAPAPQRLKRPSEHRLPSLP